MTILILFISLFVAACGRKGPPTLKAYEIPESPSALTAIHKEGKIILSWSYPKGASTAIKGFQLMRAEGNAFERIAFIESANNLFIDTGFKTGAEYNYKIVAQSLKDVLSRDSTITVRPRPLPAPPDSIEFDIKNDLIELSWKSSGEAVCYNIYRTAEKGKYTENPVNREPVCKTSFSDSVFHDTAVYYRISALLNTDIRDEGYPSTELEVNPSDFVPSPPTDLRIVMDDDRVYLIWKEGPESWVRGYRIYRKIEGETEFKVIGVAKTPVFTDTEKTYKKTLYMVKALGPSSESKPLTGEIKRALKAD